MSSVDTEPSKLVERGKGSAPGWLVSPQRVWMRRAIFQIHLWCGVLLAAYAIVIGITGSALVFKDELLHRLQPTLYQVKPAKQQTSLDAAVRKIQLAHPQWQAFALRDFNRPGHAADLLMRQVAGKPTPNYRVVSFNPYTGEVLLDSLRYAGWLGFLSNLHVYLLSGQTGLLVSGWMALGLLVLCVSGLVLWWPGVQRWTAAFWLHRRSSWRRVNWDVHTVLGFWSCAALLVVTLTGVDFAFPRPSGKVLELLTGGGFHSTGVALDSISRKSVPSHATVMTIDQAVAAAMHVLPPDAPPNYLQLPSTPSSPFRVTGYYEGAAPYSQLVRILLDPHTGELLAYSDTRRQNLGSRIEQYFVAVHFGLFGGPAMGGLVVKCLWVVLGLVPALLAATGVLMYWNRTLRTVFFKRTPGKGTP